MITISSWNINSIRIRTSLVEKFIDESNPDILLLQEIKCTEDEFPDFYSSKDYNIIINGQKGKYGVATLIKKKYEFKEISLQSEVLNKEARVCLVYLKKLNLNILNLYTPNGNPISDSYKLNFKCIWLEELAKVTKKYIDSYKELVVGGDFNVLENKLDVKDFSLWENDALGHSSIIKKFRILLSNGLINTSRLFFEPGKKYTFWDYQKSCWERNDGLHIDHFLVSPKISNKLQELKINMNYRGMSKPSDHVPITLKLTF